MKNNSEDDNNAFAKAETSKKIALAFYNLENLFNTTNDVGVLDHEFLPDSDRKWTEKRYDTKIKKLAEVISKISEKDTGEPPALVGVAEVENISVLNDLVQSESLATYKYGIVHYDSPDERGIDVALLYRKDYFSVNFSEPLTLHIESEPGVRDFTRDVLYVEGNLEGKTIHLLVNHWPSRRSGDDATSYKRVAAAQLNREKVQAIKDVHPNAKIVIMGDFNDDPFSTSIKDHLVQKDFYNPMIFLQTRYSGSLNFKFEWFVFDQIILSNNFIQMYNNDLLYDKSEVYNDHYLTEYDGKFKGNPFRTYAGDKYLGGYSDHFPVYIILISKS